MISIDIPVPPSANALFANRRGDKRPMWTAKLLDCPKRRGRIMTKAYKAWITAAGWRVKEQRPGAIAGPFDIEIQIPANTPGDLDNRVKATLDLLVSLHITPDDRHAQRVTAARVPGLVEARIIISEAV